MLHAYLIRLCILINNQALKLYANENILSLRTADELESDDYDEHNIFIRNKCIISYS